MTTKRAARAKARSATRVPPETRRKQLVSVASKLLTEHGLEHVQITEVAERANVSRPLVYRLFPTRKALVRAVLEDFAHDLSERFQQALLRGWPGTLDSATRAFIDACCDAIEARGAGPWLLLDAHGADPELARLGRATLDALLEPWQKRLAELGGLSSRRAASVLRIVVAAGRAALDGWLDGTSSRAQASDDSVRAVSVLLQVFAVASEPPRTEETKPASKPRTKSKVSKRRDGGGSR
ncbi:MAG: TetR/AcrR family transcriptional regulator [Myxococcales bacterium]|nr:TetR/AcrR family transcriptional regulator [Myxococcales bacterium]